MKQTPVSQSTVFFFLMGIALLTHRFPACLGHYFHGVVLGWIPDYRSPCLEPKLGKSKPYGYHIIFCSSRPCCSSELPMPVLELACNVDVPILRRLGYYAQSRRSIRLTSKGLHFNLQSANFRVFRDFLLVSNLHEVTPPFKVANTVLLLYHSLTDRIYITFRICALMKTLRPLPVHMRFTASTLLNE